MKLGSSYNTLRRIWAFLKNWILRAMMRSPDEHPPLWGSQPGQGFRVQVTINNAGHRFSQTEPESVLRCPEWCGQSPNTFKGLIMPQRVRHQAHRLSNLSHTMYLSNTLNKSSPSKNVNLLFPLVITNKKMRGSLLSTTVPSIRFVRWNHSNQVSRMMKKGE